VKEQQHARIPLRDTESQSYKDSSITFVSSLAARASVKNISAYAATKGAIDTIVKHFAAALGPKGTKVLTFTAARYLHGMSLETTYA
jgi:NAD(P)-dependent dehydrogenase (short-subunit alcohol dehydrogenase family)